MSSETVVIEPLISLMGLHAEETGYRGTEAA